MLQGENSECSSVMPSASGVFPEQTVQLLWIHILALSCQAPGSDSQRALCRLADEFVLSQGMWKL